MNARSDRYPDLLEPRATTSLRRAGTVIAICTACAGGCHDSGAQDDRAADAAAASTTQATQPASSANAKASSVAENIADANTIASADGLWRVSYRTTPSPIPLNASFTIDVRVVPTSGEAGQSLSVDAAMPEHSHGMNVEPRVTAIGEGRFKVEGMLFHMPGRWELYFDVTCNGITSRAQHEVTLQ